MTATPTIPTLTPVKGYSQFGEEGLIRDALRWIGTKNKWCFEVGASDGITNSNTRKLREAGWHAVLIEKDDDLFRKLRADSLLTDTVIHYEIGRSSLDRILADNAAPPDIDLGVIDIDGQDYWVWDSLIEFRPRLAMIEVSYRGAGDPPPMIDGGGREQAGIAAMDSLAEKKDYVRIAETACNALYVAKEEIP